MFHVLVLEPFVSPSQDPPRAGLVIALATTLAESPTGHSIANFDRPEEAPVTDRGNNSAPAHDDVQADSVAGLERCAVPSAY